MSGLGDRIKDVLSLDPAAVAVDYAGATASWGELAEAGAAIERLLREGGVEADAPIGWAARNRPGAVAAFASLVANGRMVVPLRPNYAVANFREDILTQRLKAVIAEDEDWRGEGVAEAAREAGTLGIRISGPPFVVELVPELTSVGPGPHRAPMPGFVLERLTSGTTGAPKRIPVREDVLVPSLKSGEQRSRGAPEEVLRLKSSPAILFKPFSHAGGLFGLMLALFQARPIVLFEKFVVSDWAAAMRKYRPKSVSLVPAMIRMVLEENVPKEDLSSLLAVRSGTAPLEPAIQEAFESRYGVPILIDYGAAEFIGGIAGWTLKDYQAFGKEKRGSAGRPRGDVRLRAVDVESFEPKAAGEEGLLEIRSDRFGPDWIRTNDLAVLDEDGFLFLRGRADDAINRGGFKVLPEEVAAVLREHPAVADAAIVGRPDERLGQVPVAAVELAENAVDPEADSFKSFLRERLPAYMVPVEFKIVDALPRTASLKVSRPDLKRMLGIS